MKMRGVNGMISFYAAKRQTLSKKEAQLFGTFYYNVVKQTTSSDRALGTFLHFARYSLKPGIPQLSQLHKEGKLPPTTLWYGSKDWMDTEHSYEWIK